MLFGKKGMYKKTTAAALAAMLGVTTVPFVSVESALAATNSTGIKSEVDAKERPSYDSVFKVSTDNFTYQNNGGIYNSSTPLSNMFDGDKKTHWETGRQNTEEFKNYVIVTFKEKVQLGEIVYHPRVQGAPNKGFPKKFSIYASSQDEGEDFKLVHQGSAKVASGALNIKLKEYTDFKRLKFVFDESDQHWSAGAELEFYKPDPLKDKTDALFTDRTMSQVKDGITLDEVKQMLEEAKTHPSVKVTEKLELAKEILEGKNLAQDVFTVDQRGDGVHHAQNVLKTSSYGSNLLPIGIAALVGQTIKVYVEADEDKPLPKIVFTQQVGTWSNWKKSFDLKPGENILTVPKMHGEKWSVIAGGAIYVENPYTEDQQGKAPRIRIEGGHSYPLFEDGENVEVFKQELRDYKEKLNAEPKKYVDIVELVNDYAILNSNMESADTVFLNSEQTPQKTLDFHKDRLSKFFAYAGITEKGEENHIRNGARANFRLMQPYGFAYAANDHTGFQQSSATTIFRGSLYGWAIAHEIGHHFDHKDGYILEVTNNMWSNYNVVELQNEDDRVEGSYADIFTKQASDDYATMDFEVNPLGIW